MTSSIAPCCLQGFRWEGTPTGRIEKLGKADVYIAGTNTDLAILLVHDLLGWTWPNIRLLADTYAQELNATVYVPDFFGGIVLPSDIICAGRWEELDLADFGQRNSRVNREPEIFECARVLRAQYKILAAIGYCFGGWAVFRLGAKEHQPPLVDFITVGHPSWLTKQDIEEVAVPVQILAPERDPQFTPDLKAHSFHTFQKLGVAFEYHHFPGATHACFTRGDSMGSAAEKGAMLRGKYAFVHWVKQQMLNLEQGNS
jgi:dienelactone hydrolase